MNKPVSSGKTNTSRRRLLKQLTTAGGTAAALQTLPAAWVRPMVQSAILPAHAQLTSVMYFGTNLLREVAADGVRDRDLFGKLAGLVTPAARAAEIEPAGSGCATSTGDQVAVIWQSPENTRRWEGNLPANGGVGTMIETARSPNCALDPNCSPVFARIISMGASGVKMEINACNKGYIVFTIPPSTICNLPTLDGGCPR